MANIIYGDQTDNYLWGSVDDDILRGLGGNDSLFGGQGNDVLEGGAGNDLLDGGEGNNTYLFGRGDGQDLIQSWNNLETKHNMIRFGEDIAPSDIVVERIGERLELRIQGTTDSISVDWYFLRGWNQNGAANPHGIEEFRFFDGTSWSRETILAMLNPIVELDDGDNFSHGTSADGKRGNDFLTGSWGDDVLRGGDGNDTIFAEDGDDIIDGGAGDDRLDAGYGNNTIHFSRGAGHDTLRIDNAWGSGNLISIKDALPGTVAFARSGNGHGEDLIISYRDTDDTMTVTGFFAPKLSGQAGGVRIQFADRTILTSWEIQNEVYMARPGTNQIGSDGWDTLTGSWGDDSLAGRGGDDHLDGYEGNDTLQGEDGNDQLMGSYGNDLLDGGTGDDRLDGGMGNDVLIGGAGRDDLFGGDGDDILDAGAGDAHLNGGMGNNIILFGRSAGHYFVIPPMAPSLNTIVLAADVRPDDVVVFSRGYEWELSLGIKGTQARIILPLLNDWQNGGYEPTESYTQLKFADGTVWDNEILLRMRFSGDGDANFINGTSGENWMDGRGGDDHLHGLGGNDTLRGGAGNDMLVGGQGNDILLGQEGDDHLLGDDGDDLLNGGAGDDRLMGGSGTNVYQIDLNGGRDIVDVWSWGETSNSVQFGAGIDPDNILVRLDRYSGELVLTLNEGMDQVTVVGPRGANGLPEPLNEIRFANGVTWDAAEILRASTRGNNSDNLLEGTHNNDLMDGRGGDDYILAFGGDDVLLGGAGNDMLMGGSGNNTFNGGTGNDHFAGDTERDTYIFNIGDGQDYINEFSFGWGWQQGFEYQTLPNTIRFGQGIARGDLQFDLSGETLTIYYGQQDSIQIPYSRLAGPLDAVAVDSLPVDRFEFADNSVWTYRELINHAPELALPIGELYATEGKAMQFQIPHATFVDPDGETLRYRLEREDGGALPAWLQFDAMTGNISGTPGFTDSGEYLLKVTASDRIGASASDVFRLKVENIDRAPQLQQAIATQHATETGLFSVTIAPDTFVDPDGGPLSYQLTMGGAPLPHWLHFDAASMTLSGTPGDADTGSVPLRLTATDAAGYAAYTDYTLEVANINQAPVLSQQPANQSAIEASSFALRIPAAFFDRDAGDVLSYTLALADGALPAWLHFDAATMTLSGTAGHADTGVLNLRLAATDSGGKTVSAAFTLTVADVNQAPVLVQAVADQLATEASRFSLTVPAAAFADADGDALSFLMVSLNGLALPAWLHFDAATMTLSGTPGDADTGMLRLQLTATDNGGRSVATEFALDVRNINQAPVLVHMPADQSVEDGVPFSYVLSANMFSDADAGDSGALSVEGMPSWLSFNGETRTFSGTPALANVGPLALTVVFTDRGAQSASAGFVLNVTAAASMKLTGGAGADQLTGKSNSDVLIGLGGDDVLNGGMGADRMEGGAGNDTIYVDNAGDTVVELAGQGTDTVMASISHTLASNVERLTLTGSSAINATGNSLNNALTGNSGANVIDGGLGDDTMVGGGRQRHLYRGQHQRPRARGRRRRRRPGRLVGFAHLGRQPGSTDLDRHRTQRHRQCAGQPDPGQRRQQRPDRGRRQRHLAGRCGRRQLERHLD